MKRQTGYRLPAIFLALSVGLGLAAFFIARAAMREIPQSASVVVASRDLPISTGELERLLQEAESSVQVESTDHTVLLSVDCTDELKFSAEVLDIAARDTGFPISGTVVLHWAFREVPQIVVELGILGALLLPVIFLAHESVGRWMRFYAQPKWQDLLAGTVCLGLGGILFWGGIWCIRVPAPLLPQNHIFDFAHYSRIFQEYTSLSGSQSFPVQVLLEALPWVSGLSLGMLACCWIGSGLLYRLVRGHARQTVLRNRSAGDSNAM